MSEENPKVKLMDLITPSEKQKIAFEKLKTHKFLLYGGAMYGGKSYWLRWALVVLLIYYFRKYKKKGVIVGLFCEDYPALKDRHLSKIDTDFPSWLGTMHSDHKSFGKSFILNASYGGGVIVFRNLDDPSKYASAEFAAIAVDELTKNTEDKFTALRHRLRWPGIEDVKFIAGTNPGSIGHAWVKKRWMDKEFEPEEQEAEQFVYVPAKYTDNPNKSKSYELTLNSLPPALAKAFRDGDWDTFEGQYFEKWNREIHTHKPFKIPMHWMRFLWMDYGYSAPSAVHWVALDEIGRLWVYRELYQTGLTYKTLSKKIMEMTPDWERELLDGNMVCDPAVFAKKGEDEKERSGAEQMYDVSKGWLNWRRGNNDRINGWGIMREYIEPFKYDDEITAKLIYFTTCKEAIRTIPALVYDSLKIEDVDTKGDDHCFTGDTLVDLTDDNKVYTLNGKRNFVNPRKTRIEKVYKITLEDGREIKSTIDHRYFTNNGWKKLKDLDIKVDLLIQLDICKSKLYQKQFKNLAENDTISAEDIFKEMGGDYTSQFGKNTKEISKKDFTSITRMEIDLIMILKTLKKYLLENISQFILKTKRILKGLKNYNRLLKQKQSNGTNLKQEEGGIANTQKRLLKNGYMLKKNAKSVVKNIKHQNNLQIGQNTAIRIVKLEPCGREEVYNLTVPEIEHFTINGGIVVHNCGDADRYGIMDVHETFSEKAPEPPKEIRTTDEIKKRDLQLIREEEEMKESGDVDWMTM